MTDCPGLFNLSKRRHFGFQPVKVVILTNFGLKNPNFVSVLL